MKKINEVANVENHAKKFALQNQLKNWNEEAEKIQSSFDFTVPDYILDEIIEHKNCSNKNLYYIINCAVLNGRLSCENAKKLKAIY